MSFELKIEMAGKAYHRAKQRVSKLTTKELKAAKKERKKAWRAYYGLIREQEQREKLREVLKRRCPICKVKIGELCKGKEIYGNSFHTKRNEDVSGVREMRSRSSGALASYSDFPSVLDLGG